MYSSTIHGTMHFFLFFLFRFLRIAVHRSKRPLALQDTFYVCVYMWNGDENLQTTRRMRKMLHIKLSQKRCIFTLNSINLNYDWAKRKIHDIVKCKLKDLQTRTTSALGLFWWLLLFFPLFLFVLLVFFVVVVFFFRSFVRWFFSFSFSKSICYFGIPKQSQHCHMHIYTDTFGWDC